MGKIINNYKGIYGIVDLSFKNKVSPLLWTEIFVKTGVKIIQLRGKKSTPKELLSVAKEMRKLIPDDYLFIVNDRPDIAILSEADGVHLGQDDIPPFEIREKFPELIIGHSTHNLEQVKSANYLDVDYIGFGPIYPTKSKEKPDPVVGTEMLQEAIGISSHPIVAIGGLKTKNIHTILTSKKPDFFCIVSGLALSENMEKEISKLKEIYEKS